ncbi:transposase [Bradyrhizobium sp. GM7.3]
MKRRKLSREFKIAVRERGVSVAQAGRDLDVHEKVLRRWVKEFGSDPVQAFPAHGQMKPEQQEIERLRREVAKLKAERDILKNCPALWRACAGLKQPCGIFLARRVAAVSLLEAECPLKNVVHGCMRTWEW